VYCAYYQNIQRPLRIIAVTMNRCFPLSGLLVACLLAATSVIFYAAGSLTAANERWMATSAANHWVVGKG